MIPAEALGVEVEGVGGKTGRRGRLERRTAAKLGTMAGLGTAAGEREAGGKKERGEGGAANEKQREKHERGSRRP